MSTFRKPKIRVQSRQRITTRTPDQISNEDPVRPLLSRNQLPSPKLSFSSASSYEITKSIISRREPKLIKIRKIYSTSSPDKAQKVHKKRNKPENSKEEHFTPLLPNLKSISSQGFEPKMKHEENSSMIFIKEFPEKLPARNSMISFKKAMKNKKWLAKAKDFLKTEFNKCLKESNGINVVSPENSVTTYKYYVGKGNNSGLVKQVMQSRWWWVEVEEAENMNVNLYWSQLFNSQFSGKIPEAVPFVDNSTISKPLSVSCLNIETDISNNVKVDISVLGFDLITQSSSYTTLKEMHQYVPNLALTHNRLPSNDNLCNKKALYRNMKAYYTSLGKNVFDYLPLTFHLVNGENDEIFTEFSQCFEEFKEKSQNLWILKPGENTNRGNGICVCNSIEQIKNELRNNPFPRTGEHTYILQKYIENPLLISRRKFDIRLYAMLTSVNGIIQGYFYKEGYLRTACKAYTAKNLDNKYIHLTNDAVQKKSEDYGKYENGNKISYKEFQRYLDIKRIDVSFMNDIIPKIKDIVKDTFMATFQMIDKERKSHSFEIYGYDFLLDTNFTPWLLEVNTNPCLELSSPLLGRIIPSMLDNAFRIAVDPVFPEIAQCSRRSNVVKESYPPNKFELIFHELIDGKNPSE
ncbi:unnamed protein product [Blepharisma stoltei]|uniref:Uncharacterized protein n=1 Tax=Blepharisma stoltei TaxID=1481888 RepID=A0AAU9J855_9CILI|nr:unnamed protein product [Blepharisma stoltei]